MLPTSQHPKNNCSKLGCKYEHPATNIQNNSRIDYGYIVYNSVGHKTFKKLDPIYHHAIRIAVGAFRTSPIIDILSEAMEVPLKIGRMHLSIKFAAKISSTP